MFYSSHSYSSFTFKFWENLLLHTVILCLLLRHTPQSCLCWVPLWFSGHLPQHTLTCGSSLSVAESLDQLFSSPAYPRTHPAISFSRDCCLLSTDPSRMTNAYWTKLGSLLPPRCHPSCAARPPTAGCLSSAALLLAMLGCGLAAACRPLRCAWDATAACLRCCC